MVPIDTPHKAAQRKRCGATLHRFGPGLLCGLTVLILSCSTEAPPLPPEPPCAPLVAYNELSPTTNQPVQLQRSAAAPTQVFQVPDEALEECEAYRFDWTLDDMDPVIESLGSGQTFELHPCDDNFSAADPYTTVLHVSIRGSEPDDGMTRLSWTVIIRGDFADCSP